MNAACGANDLRISEVSGQGQGESCHGRQRVFTSIRIPSSVAHPHLSLGGDLSRGRKSVAAFKHGLFFVVKVRWLQTAVKAGQL